MNKLMPITLLLLTGCVTFNAAAKPVNVKVYETGEQIEKPMVMSRFVELRNARKIQDIDFSDQQQNKVNLAQHHGKLVMVNLWATWCAPCIKEIPAMQAIKERNQDKDFALVPISIDENPDDIKPFFEQHGFDNYATWIDPDKNVDYIMPADLLPASFILDGKGNLVGFVRGYIDWTDEGIQPYLDGLIEKYAHR
ncbi:redoxin [Shewanella sp. 10N.286.51.B7]|uniref:TlpA family protein disulfide reductase n=1 Tax=Shewanella sp. 10N.286.51.B7 TaxID=1880836 RepID=UPI000C827B30|nr:TlpA disulfide reductase family protein [Shewanella sp. 10N.286.51.B7]PMG70987.1 redoxin [Shewanella sp. 10N.286.51.B7]